jgi:hypothetical protein
MQSLLRLAAYVVLLAVLLTIITSFPETSERVLVQILIFASISLYLVILIRQALPHWRRAWPEALYLLASLYFAVASVLRLFEVA